MVEGGHTALGEGWRRELSCEPLGQLRHHLRRDLGLGLFAVDGLHGHGKFHEVEELLTADGPVAVLVEDLGLGVGVGWGCRVRV